MRKSRSGASLLFSSLFMAVVGSAAVTWLV
jgi:hypothetical protein